MEKIFKLVLFTQNTRDKKQKGILYMLGDEICFDRYQHFIGEAKLTPIRDVESQSKSDILIEVAKEFPEGEFKSHLVAKAMLIKLNGE